MEVFQICPRPHPHSTLAVIPANADNVRARCARRAAHDARLSTGLGARARGSDTHQERGQGGLRLELTFVCGGDSLVDFLFPRWKDYRWKFSFLSRISSTPNEIIAGFMKMGGSEQIVSNEG